MGDGLKRAFAATKATQGKAPRRARKPVPPPSMKPWPVEEWKSIPGYDGYEVSSLGNVRTWRVYAHAHCRAAEPRVIGQRLNKSGYAIVCLQYGHRRRESRSPTVHGLVLTAFVGPRPTGKQCRHLDGNRTNNRIENLRWGTAAENIADRERHGTTARGARHGWHTKPHKIPRGERHWMRIHPESIPRGSKTGMARTTEAEVVRIREMHRDGVSYSKIARAVGLTKGNVGKIVRRELWTHVA